MAWAECARLLRSRVGRGRYASIEVPNNHEAHIKQSTFDAVQAKLEARSRVHGGPFRKYLLSGILRCGHCGSILNGHGGRGRDVNKRFMYYMCKRAAVSGTCQNYGVRIEVIEQTTLEHFRDAWSSPAGQEALRKAIRDVNRQRASEKPARLKELESQLAKAAFGRIFKSITLFWKQVSRDAGNWCVPKSKRDFRFVLRAARRC